MASLSDSTPFDSDQFREQFDTGNESGVELRMESYSSLADLRQRWMALDDAEVGARLSVVLILHEEFSADIVSLIRRRYMALQLTVVPLGMSLPGPNSIADLVWTRYQLGWHELTVDRDLAAAMKRTQTCSDPEDCVIVFWPEWHPGLAEAFQNDAFDAPIETPRWIEATK